MNCDSLPVNSVQQAIFVLALLRSILQFAMKITIQTMELLLASSAQMGITVGKRELLEQRCLLNLANQELFAMVCEEECSWVISQIESQTPVQQVNTVLKVQQMQSTVQLEHIVSIQDDHL